MMVKIGDKMNLKVRNLMIVLLPIQISACTGQEKEKAVPDVKEIDLNTIPVIVNQNTTFPQIHSNLNGMVREFVRTMYQDKKGHYWFGTNGGGIIRFDGKTLEAISIKGVPPNMRVLEIAEDQSGNLWFGTSGGLIKYDGREFTKYSVNESMPNEEIWGLAIDKSGLIWLGTTGGVLRFDGENFTPFDLPDSRVENLKSMLSHKLVFKILEDRNGYMWFATDGNGIFKYHKGTFTHLTTRNGLADNNTADILEDRQGNIWIGSFNGGVSKFDGTTYTNFTKDGIIDGEETYNLYEDSKGNIWFTAEGYGVYRYDGNGFKRFTAEDGLTSNVTQSILEDNKGQIWFGSWQGLCIYDGQAFMNANVKEPWTR